MEEEEQKLKEREINRQMEERIKQEIQQLKQAHKDKMNMYKNSILDQKALKQHQKEYIEALKKAQDEEDFEKLKEHNKILD